MLGDLVMNERTKERTEEKVNNNLNIVQNKHGILWKSVLDTKIGKLKAIIIYGTDNHENINIEYSKFKGENHLFPGIIDFEDQKRKISARIQLIRVEIPWKGEINFVPGKGYLTEEIK